MTDPALEREAIALFEQLLEVPEADRESWIDQRCSDRPELRNRLRAMLLAERQFIMQTGGAVGTLGEEIMPERIGTYRILERIGRGGMGSVYRAERDRSDFQHVVAIKVIKPGLLTERLVDRFRSERQILAQLSHPHIAQLFDGGETDDGSPFIVMEYVEGLPLGEWLETAKPGREERLKIFRQIASAVAFAHSHLIVHRDITPSNVLIVNGRAKLIDFGIARPVDLMLRETGTWQATGSTRPSIASFSLTPGFAAPERITDAQVTTALDIYSLGKLLETLFPEGQHGAEIAAIIARATASDATDRYPSVDGLIGEIDAMEENRPVAAMAPSKRYLFGRFVARNRLLMATASGALLLLVTASLAIGWSYLRAEAARSEAEMRFDQTRSIARLMLFEIFYEVSRVPGSTRARQQLASTALTYLDALAADGNAPPDVRIEAGVGYVRLARVIGGGGALSLGRFEDANGLLAEAERILRPLHEERPGDRAAAAAYADLMVEKAFVDMYNNNDIANGRRAAQIAERVIAPFATDSIDNAVIYGSALHARGDADGWDNVYARAVPLHEQSERFFAGLPTKMRDDYRIQGARAANLRAFGEALHKTKQKDRSLEAIDQAVALNESLYRRFPTDPAITRRLILSLRYRAIVHRTNLMDDSAKASIDRAMELVRQFRRGNPGDGDILALFALVAEVKAQTLADSGSYTASYAMTDEIVAAQKERIRLAGNAPGALRSLGQSLRTGGTNHHNGGDYAGACRLWGEAMDVWRELKRRDILSGLDQKSVDEMQQLMRDGCNPPREVKGFS